MTTSRKIEQPSPKILIAANSAWNLANFRLGLIRGLIDAGYEVIAVAPPDEHEERIKALGCRFLPFPLDNQGTNPIKDLWLFWRFLRLLRTIRPRVYLGYTVKPNVYGSLAAHLLGVPVINTITGLGTVFIKINWLTELAKLLYKAALAKSFRVFFQNEDDRQLFINYRLVNVKKTDCLPGSGVNVTDFSHVLMPSSELPTRFLLIARMLWDKGISEYVEACKIIAHDYTHTDLPSFFLLGFLDVANPSAISRSQMDELVRDGVVTYLGATDDVRPHIANASCVVLPSYYREGTPRTLLEAAAMGRPIITADSVGCREVVDDELNGYLCKVRDPHDLAEKMKRFIALSHSERSSMGLHGRKKIEREFDEQIVVEKYLTTIAKIVSQQK